jgi:tyrosyl-tRNA synthetase
MKINNDPEQVNKVLSRGLDEVIGLDFLKSKMLKGEKVKLYLGIDPTSTNLHIGHMVPLLKLKDFMDLGHEVVFLVGNFTALIGDTSDKTSMRPAITTDEISENLKSYKQQASKILDFDKVELVFNGDWLEKLNFKDIILLAQEFTLKPFIDRELMAKRIKEEQPIGLHELLYPIMQAYDAYNLDVDLQVGGTDQRFNMLTGRDLQKRKRGKEMAIITVPLLMGLDGRKMSKSYNNGINLLDNAIDKYGKTMSIADDKIIEYYKLATRESEENINEIETKLNTGESPMEIKKQLAFEITKLYEGKNEAIKAQEYFQSVVQDKSVPNNAKVFNIEKEKVLILELLSTCGLTTSNTESRKLIEQGAVSIENTKITNNRTNSTSRQKEFCKI